MKIYLLTEERADDSGVRFDAVPYLSREDAVREAEKRVKTFKDDIVREFVKDSFVDDNKPNSFFCTASWSMHLYNYCRIAEHELN